MSNQSKAIRKKGSGNLRRFSNRVWQASFSHKGRRYYIRAISRNEAEAKLDVAIAYVHSGHFNGTEKALHQQLIDQGFPSGVKRSVISSYNIHQLSETSWRVTVNINGKQYRFGAISQEESQMKYDALCSAVASGDFQNTDNSVDMILKAAGYPAGRLNGLKKQRKGTSTHEPFENGIRLRSEGYYEGRYYYNKKSESIYAPTKKEVEKRLWAIKTAIDDGSFIGRNKETFCGYLMSWVNFLAKSSLRPSTQSKYENYIINHFIPFFGTEKLQLITTQMLQNFFDLKKTSGRADGKEGGLAHKTLADMKNMITKALNYAVNPQMYIHYNPARAIMLKCRPPKSVPVMTSEQIELLITQGINSNEPIGWAIVILLRTGMRKGELLGLQLSRINLDIRSIMISQSLSRIKHPNKQQSIEYERVDTWAKKQNKTGLYLGPPKTYSSDREIPVGQQVIECIQKMIKYQESLMGHTVDECPNQGANNFLLVNSKLRAYDPKTFDEHFKKFLSKSGIFDISVHSTRHSFTTDILAKFPEELPSISEIVGHADKSTTLRYTHGSDEKKRMLMDSF